jgi:hypothetical protein
VLIIVCLCAGMVLAMLRSLGSDLNSGVTPQLCSGVTR